MTCLLSDFRAEIEARLAENRIILAEAKTALREALKGGIESYRFDSGEGSQRTTRRKLKDIKDLIDRLETDIRADEEALLGIGITSLNLRRKQYNRRWYV